MKLIWTNLLAATSGDVRRLSHVNRFSSIPVRSIENVAEHSYWVVLYSLMIHNELKVHLHLNGDDDCTGNLLSYATVHDLPECLTGDIPRLFKYSSKTLQKKISEAESDMAERLPNEVKKILKSSNQILDDEKVGWYIKAVVKAADFVSLYQFLKREVNIGNNEIKPFYDRMVYDLNLMYNELKSQSEKYQIHNIRSIIYDRLASLYYEMTEADIQPRYTV